MQLISENVTNFVQKLPEDIINRIIPFTYSPKSQTLLYDIRNYHNTLNLIEEIYFRYWDIGGFHRLDSQWLLIFQLKKYANNNREPCSFFDSFRRIWFRNFTLNNNEDFDNFMVKYLLKSVQTQINMFWGILTPHERIDFIINSLREYLN